MTLIGLTILSHSKMVRDAITTSGLTQSVRNVGANGIRPYDTIEVIRFLCVSPIRYKFLVASDNGMEGVSKIHTLPVPAEADTLRVRQFGGTEADTANWTHRQLDSLCFASSLGIKICQSRKS
jgi:hypothetical protein